jgi:hypothetical protein
MRSNVSGEATPFNAAGSNAKLSSTASLMAGASLRTAAWMRWSVRSSPCLRSTYSKKTASRPVPNSVEPISDSGRAANQPGTAGAVPNHCATIRQAMPPTTATTAISCSLVL